MSAEPILQQVEEQPSRLSLQPTEVQQAVQEDPLFADELGRIRAKLMRVEYDPDLHHPHRRKRAFDVPDGFEEKLREIIQRFQERSPRRPRIVKEQNDLLLERVHR